MVGLASEIYLSPDQTELFLGLPFFPIEEEKGRWYLGCVNLLPNGKCGDYENRPYGPCVIFEPASSPICVYY